MILHYFLRVYQSTPPRSPDGRGPSGESGSFLSFESMDDSFNPSLSLSLSVLAACYNRISLMFLPTSHPATSPHRHCG
ncbi:hypothetical protein Mapa_008614 [Marchantia paleacea]|nr:hypothetical protein Mapa_008614 [Marchantia paleacea]